MKILIAPDKFKGTLTATDICTIVAAELKENLPPGYSIKSFPLADGGDGTADVLQHHLGGKSVELVVRDPLMQPMLSTYLIAKDGKTAFIEMARASGLVLLAPEKRNPLQTTTYGTGELIRDAMAKGVRRIYLGVGGSATNDGGAGALAALGVQFRDKSGKSFIPTGGTLSQIAEVDLSEVENEIQKLQISVLCDVTNPFTGKQGSAHVFAPQKGADEVMVGVLEEGMSNFGDLIRERTGIDLNKVSGAGAAGGLAGGLHAFLGAALRSGIRAIMELTRFEDTLRWADLVITGEGKLDEQSLKGKLVMGVLEQAQNLGKPVVIICGICGLGKRDLRKMGIQYVFELVQEASKDCSVAHPALTLKRVVRNRLINLIKDLQI
jgi:glycerate kinase